MRLNNRGHLNLNLILCKMEIKVLTSFVGPSQFQTKRFNLQLSFSPFFSLYYKLSCTAQVVRFTTQ